MLGISIDPVDEAAVLAAGPMHGKGNANRRKKKNSDLMKKIIGDLHSSLGTRREVCPTGLRRRKWSLQHLQNPVCLAQQTLKHSRMTLPSKTYMEIQLSARCSSNLNAPEEL
jgi:hypothetical protein